MSKQIDLSGNRFGALVAQRPVPASVTVDKRPGWLVKCDCGREKVVNGSNLRRGLITSCGCGMARGVKTSAALQSKGPGEDLTGQTFGQLIAVRYLGRNRWLWRCSCGAETTAKAVDVKAGNILSCGHILSETARAKITVANTVEHYDGTTVSRIRHIIASPIPHGIREIKTNKGETIYKVRITLRQREIYVGTYSTRTEAEKARRQAEEKYYLPIIKEYDSI